MKITSSPMALKEGVIANNDILDYNEFYQFMQERLTTQVLNQILHRFRMIRGHIQRNEIKSAYIMWENFQKDILLNPNYFVSLMFIGNINAGDAGQYTFQYATKEADVMGNRGKLTRISQLNKKMFGEYLEEIISAHLYEFLNQIETTVIPWKFIQKTFNEGDSDIKRNAAYARWQSQRWTYKEVFYGNNPVWHGNAADAFMNHLAKNHAQLFSNSLSTEDKNMFSTTVFNEERDNIYDLLYASKNTTSWITGGDIIIKYQNEIINIQLKTGQQQSGSRRRSRIGGKLATAELLIFIEEMIQEIQGANLNKIIDKFYNELKTSGWVENVNQAVTKVADKLVDSSMGIKYKT